jgi:hypothetical protein
MTVCDMEGELTTTFPERSPVGPQRAGVPPVLGAGDVLYLPGAVGKSVSRNARSGFIAPSLLPVANIAPLGPRWIHEIKHDALA